METLSCIFSFVVTSNQSLVTSLSSSLHHIRILNIARAKNSEGPSISGNKNCLLSGQIRTSEAFSWKYIDVEGWNCYKLTIFQLSETFTFCSRVSIYFISRIDVQIQLFLFIADFGSGSTIIGMFAILTHSNQSRSHWTPILVPLTQRDILAGNLLNDP